VVATRRRVAALDTKKCAASRAMIEIKPAELALNDVRKSIEQALERRAARDASRVGLEIRMVECA
jgi:hypothetical protein